MTKVEGAFFMFGFLRLVAGLISNDCSSKMYKRESIKHCLPNYFSQLTTIQINQLST